MVQHCLNCAAELRGPYCHQCGQKHLQQKETLGHLLMDFFGGLFNFESKFFHTLIPLLFRPGRLSRLYIEGKRASQLHPIRLYLFASFLYFLFFFSFTSTGKRTDFISHGDETATQGIQEADSVNASPKSHSKNNNDLVIASNRDSTVQFSIGNVYGVDTLIRQGITEKDYVDIQSAQAPEKRDHFFKSYIIRKSLHLYEEGKKDGSGLLSKITTAMIHNIPKMLFFVLPVFAFLLKLLYIRKKKFYYVDHAVLSLHYFSFIFIILFLSQFIFDKVFNTHWFTTLSVWWIVIYFFIAMRRLYEQSFLKTLVKYFMLALALAFVISGGFLLNIILSALAA